MRGIVAFCVEICGDESVMYFSVMLIDAMFVKFVFRFRLNLSAQMCSLVGSISAHFPCSRYSLISDRSFQHSITQIRPSHAERMWFR